MKKAAMLMMALALPLSACGGEEEPATRCTNYCQAEGLTQCSGELVQTCEADAEGCLAWSTPTPCDGGNGCINNTCSTSAPLCGPSNCAGCCINNQCLGGTTPSACGGSGLQCMTCGNAQVCKADRTCGEPEQTCGPSSCAGCCFNNQCQAGTATSACGKGGVACTTCGTNQVCSATTQTCQAPPPTCGPSTCASGCCLNGQCQTGTANAACGSGGTQCTTCGTNQICKANKTCGVDPTSRWKVQPTSAVIAATNNGTAWDGDGSGPDVKITMQCPPSSAPVSTSTPEAPDTWQPTWTTGGCITTAAALLAEPWTFWVWDADLTTNDSITGGLQLQIEERHFTAGALNASGAQGLDSLVLQLQKQ